MNKEDRKKKKAIAEAIAIRYGRGKHAPKDAAIKANRLIEQIKKDGVIRVKGEENGK